MPSAGKKLVLLGVIAGLTSACEDPAADNNNFPGTCYYPPTLVCDDPAASAALTTAAWAALGKPASGMSMSYTGTQASGRCTTFFAALPILRRLSRKRRQHFPLPPATNPSTGALSRSGAWAACLYPARSSSRGPWPAKSDPPRTVGPRAFFFPSFC